MITPLPDLKELINEEVVELTGKSTSCKHCGQSGLEWAHNVHEGKWVLLGVEDGVVGRHVCLSGKYAKKPISVVVSGPMA